MRSGTELVFSPVRHPQSQGAVERFHRDYQRHVWAKADWADLAAVQRYSTAFVARYRASTHHAVGSTQLKVSFTQGQP